jgi:hypothetical protein
VVEKICFPAGEGAWLTPAFCAEAGAIVKAQLKPTVHSHRCAELRIERFNGVSLHHQPVFHRLNSVE